jgi:putative hemolysin
MIHIPNATSHTSAYTGESARRRRAPTLAALLMVGLALAGCSTGGNVTGTTTPGVYEASASTTGGRMAWASAHEHAMQRAEAYCEQRGMQASPKLETTSGVTMMDTHESQIEFECHPKL